jgi:hypothetical protein
VIKDATANLLAEWSGAAKVTEISASSSARFEAAYSFNRRLRQGRFAPIDIQKYANRRQSGRKLNGFVKSLCQDKSLEMNTLASKIPFIR